MSPLVTIRRCATLPEALIVHGLLLDRGVDASLSNYAHASMDWWSLAAFNGVGIDVPAHEYDLAKVAIIDAATEGPAILETQFGTYEEPDRYGRLIVWIFWLNFFGVFLIALIAAGWLLDVILPEAWIAWLIATAMPEEQGGYYFSGGTYNPVAEADFNLEGLMFVICVLLVFLADRLIKPEVKTQEDAT